MAQQETEDPEAAIPGDGQQQEDAATSGGNGAGETTSETLARELKQAVRDAALEVLGPAARGLTSSAAKYAVSKGPEFVTRNVIPTVWNTAAPGGLAHHGDGAAALSGSGGIAGLARKLMSKFGRGKGGGVASGWGRKRRMPVQQIMYVSVPVKQAYNGWTEYKQWPRYMHRANQVDAQVNDKEARVKVTEKMWGFKRPFTAEIVTQRPDEHIKWNSTEGTKHTGVINFHELGPRLTMIELNLDHSPSGMAEKFARGTRLVKRAVRGDFHRFRGWIEMKSEDELAEFEGWRGTIEGGQVVTSHEDALEEEQHDEDTAEQGPEGEQPTAPEARGEEGEPDAGEDEEPQAREQEESKADAAGEG
jgi:uncharacterized membrane protein